MSAVLDLPVSRLRPDRDSHIEAFERATRQMRQSFEAMIDELESQDRQLSKLQDELVMERGAVGRLSSYMATVAEIFGSANITELREQRRRLLALEKIAKTPLAAPVVPVEGDRKAGPDCHTCRHATADERGRNGFRCDRFKDGGFTACQPGGAATLWEGDR